MHCGQMLAQPAASHGGYGAGQVAIPAPGSRSKAWVWVLIGVFAVLAILGGLMATGILRFGGSQTLNPNLQARGEQGPPTLPATGEQGPNTLQAQGQSQPNLQATGQKIVMPDDIRKWLEHLERIEKRKRALVSDQIAAALVQLQYLLGAGATKDILQGLLDETSGIDPSDAKNPATDTRRSIGELNHDWDVLIADFNSYPPPGPCVPLRNEFDQHIREVRGQIGDIVRVFDSASDNPDAAIAILNGIKRDNRKGIDQPGVRSERLLEEICATYDTRPWFDIDPDPGRGKGLLGARGF